MEQLPLAPTPAPVPAPAAKPAPAGPVRDPVTGNLKLPPARSAAEKLKASDEESPQLAGEAAATALFAYDTEVLARHEKVVEFFKDCPEPLSPAKAKDYQKFIREHLSYLNMRYVVFGVFEKPKPTASPEGVPMKQADEDVVIPEGMDSNLAAMKSVRFALSQGVNLTDDKEDDEDDKT
jgi:hypothetical protein